MGWGELLVATRDSLEEKLPERKKRYVFLWGLPRGSEEATTKKKRRNRERWWSRGKEATEGEEEVENLDTEVSLEGKFFFQVRVLDYIFIVVDFTSIMVIVIWMNDAFFFICYLIESDLIPHSFPICVWVTFLDLVFISFFPPVHWMLCFIFPFYACSLLVYTLFSIVICILKGKGFLKTSSSWEIWGGGNLEKEKRKEGKIILRAFWGWRLRIWGFGKEGIFSEEESRGPDF